MSNARAVGELAEAVRGTDVARRRAALSNLSSRASRARRGGVADGENEALRALREVGVAPREGLTTLAELGLLEVLAPVMPRRSLCTLDLLLAATGKGLRDIRPSDVDVFVSGRPAPTAAVLRSQIRCAYDRLTPLGLADANPAPRVLHRREPLPPALAREFEVLEAFHETQRSARSSRTSADEAMRSAAEWAKARGFADGLEARLWEDEQALRDLAVWWARPRANGALRSLTCMPQLATFILRLWRAHDRNRTEGRDRIRRLQRSLRSTEDDIGPLDLLDLLSEDPAPAPAPEKCEKLALWYAAEAVRLRSLGPSGRRRLLSLQRERLVFFILWKVGVRISSLASFRYDELKRDENGQWYFDCCVTKRTRVPNRVVVPTWRVGNTTLSRWYLPPEFVALLTEALKDEGYHLWAYLSAHGEHQIPHDTARDGTYGPHMQGKRVAPVWRGKRGHLTVGRLAGIASHIVQVRLGMARGGAHAMRRRSIMDNEALARVFPQAAQALQHLTAETRARYHWSEESSVRHMFEPSESSPASSDRAPAQTSAVPVTEKQTDVSSSGRRTRLRVPRAPRLTLDDLR